MWPKTAGGSSSNALVVAGGGGGGGFCDGDASGSGTGGNGGSGGADTPDGSGGQITALYQKYLRRSPSADEQLETYRRLAEEVAPLAVTVRTLDADPDRIFRRPDSSAPSSSALGLRGIRLSLGSERARALFATQVEAILRASRHGRMEIVLPMVSAVEEVREARSIIAGMSRALAGQGERLRRV